MEQKQDVFAEEFDVVNNPPHYKQGKIECIDAIESATAGLTGFEAFCVGNVIKYVWRAKHKGDAVQDYKKAQYYLNNLIVGHEVKK